MDEFEGMASVLGPAICMGNVRCVVMIRKALGGYLFPFLPSHTSRCVFVSKLETFVQGEELSVWRPFHS